MLLMGPISVTAAAEFFLLSFRNSLYRLSDSSNHLKTAFTGHVRNGNHLIVSLNDIKCRDLFNVVDT